MALDTIIRGSTSGLGAEVTSSNELKVKLSATDGGAVRLFSENDPGAKTGTAAGQHSIQFGMYYGSAAVTLAQTETGSFVNNTIKAFRRKFLGFMTWATGAAAIGTPPDRGPIKVQFSSPVVVHPGENVGIFAQMHNGAATATGGLLFTYNFDHYFQ